MPLFCSPALKYAHDDKFISKQNTRQISGSHYLHYETSQLDDF